MAAITIPIGSRIYLDANVFIYAAETPAAFPQLIRTLHQLDLGELTAVTSSLTLAEVLVAPLRLGNSVLVQASSRQISTGRSLTVVDISRDILIQAAALRAISTSIKLPDAIHAATCKSAGCDVSLTNDTRFKAVPELAVTMLADLA